MSKDRSEALKLVPEHLREDLETLLRAQDEGLRVSIEEGGVDGETVGVVSDVRIVNDELVFKIDGKDYKPFYGITITVLEKPVEIRL
ncbi:MAG: hypothetical protein K2W82_13955 [Candidatus Obscuribacterales bacterium]|nr:hypothetical protein [Candidatus Obscuribacterales bacterium]